MIARSTTRAASVSDGRKTSPGRTGAARIVARCLLGLTLCGCYSYVPVELATVRPAEFVRVDVTEQAAVRLVKDFGAYLTSLEGQFSREGTDSVSVTVPVSRDYRGVSLEGGRQTLFLGLQEVIGVRRREFSRGRTVAVSVGSLVVFAAIVAGVAQWGDPNSEVVEPPPPPPPVGRIIFRFGIPLR
jgi:hypothetical protein